MTRTTRRSTTTPSATGRSAAGRIGTGLLGGALLAAAAAAALGTAAGCQGPSGEPTAEQRSLGVQPVPVSADWRRFAEDNFRGVVTAELRAQPDVRFTSDPDISAARRLDNGAVELTAIGDVDVNDGSGGGNHRLRRTYSVVWVRQGGGWDGGSAHLGAGRASPQPLLSAPATGPVAAPSTRALTPADPTAPAPGSAVPGSGVPGGATPLPPAGGGGTPSLPPSGGSGSPSLPPAGT